MDPKQVTDLLVKSGALTHQLGHTLVAEASVSNKPIDTLIFEQELLTREEFHRCIASALCISYYDILNFEPTPKTLQLIPPQLARIHGILPLFSNSTTIFVALSDPFNFQAFEDLRFALEKNFEQVLGDIERVRFLVHSYYGSQIQNLEGSFLTETQEDLLLSKNNSKNDSFLQVTTDSTPITQFVDLILEKAIRSRASDIHLESFESDFKIRYRVDGTLYEMMGPPPHLASAFISYIKALAHLDIAEHRLPQDGRIEYVCEKHAIDLRVSTLPTSCGESVVIRVLDQTTIQLDIETLGMPDPIFHSVMETIHKPNGIFIITGPTGSGKTTTLYSCLHKIHHADSKLLTVEDPVEYEIDGIIQVAVNENIGLDFSRVLRSFLRQDPDCILIGEIRDKETAQIAIQASLTGHLVFTTLHTNDTVGAITRLENFGIDPFLISATCEGILAQRLIRRLCPHCRRDYQPTPFQISSLELKNEKVYQGAGCEICNQTGYLGRKGIYEFLPISDSIRELVNHRASEDLLRKKALELGMIGLRQEGLRCVYAGESTLEEIWKYT